MASPAAAVAVVAAVVRQEVMRVEKTVVEEKVGALEWEEEVNELQCLSAMWTDDIARPDFEASQVHG